MTDQSESERPNEYGFAGEPTTPQPEPEAAAKPAGEVDGERIAVPAGDLTGSITDAIDEVTAHDEDDANAS